MKSAEYKYLNSLVSVKYTAGCENWPNYNEPVKLRCEADAKIIIVKGDFGRDPYSNACGDFLYDDNCTSRIDTEEILRKLCNNKGSCDVIASPENFPDPCPDVQKLLRVWYQCVGDGDSIFLLL